MKRKLFFTTILSFMSYCFVTAYDNDIIPEFPLDSNGKIEIVGGKDINLTKQDVVEKAVLWMNEIFDDIEGTEITIDEDKGLVRAKTYHLIAVDEFEDSYVYESVMFIMDIDCCDGRYDYSVYDMELDISTIAFFKYEQKGYDGMPVHFDVLDQVRLPMPDYYTGLIYAADEERNRLRADLDILMTKDISALSSSGLRRHRNDLDRAAELFEMTHEYYLLVRDNYMSCYDFFKEITTSLEVYMNMEDGV